MPHLLIGLWLAVDKVIHHDDVALPSSSGPGATLPVVIRTRAMRASSKTMPKKERLASPGEAGTKLLNISLPYVSKYSISVLAPRGFPLLPRGAIPSGSSTSVKTAPKPRIVAGYSPIGAGHEEQSFGDVAAYRSEQARPLKVLKVAP